MRLEKNQLLIGFVPLIDSAPLVAAKEKGFFEKHGLNVELERHQSWSQIRDKLAAGALDAAHMLAPMAPASWLDNAYGGERFVTGLSLNLNGNAITVSEELYRQMVEADPEAMFERPTSARALKKVIANRLKAGQETINIGTVFPFSSHNYAVRYWLGAEGLNPDRDVRMVVAPPPYMVEHLKEGKIDAFCVGEPWNTLAECDSVGRAIVRSAEIWRHMPEKVLGVRQEWADEFPETHVALVASVLEAAAWLDKRRNRLEIAEILSRNDYIGLQTKALLPSLAGIGALANRKSIIEASDYLIFHRYAANFPWRSHALWFLTQMARWGQIVSPVDLHEIAQGAYLPEIYRAAAGRLGVAYPTIDEKPEGAEEHAWMLSEATTPIAMPSSRFVDGFSFNPDAVISYLEGFKRHNLRISLREIADLHS
ncbi:CmpA/NrtA family ABC transporter substrate-binding protein [Hyphococcus luteus]|uniref:Nitrate ABC transporter n=1 Tax=Hyphococcus luteus TaxID=2058213 RepID=A0A2S7K1J4_9PROT|nr:CmpA/NrtA family ABC transporter substrate-binding protein [Marinicaulis flavus]PQA86372.1 nitrate ABC transporter [Marinicaulis flavus]